MVSAAAHPFLAKACHPLSKYLKSHGSPPEIQNRACQKEILGSIEAVEADFLTIKNHPFDAPQRYLYPT